MAGPLPPQPQILDVACGPGMQTMDLAALLPQARIVAIDTHAPFLEELQRRAKAAGAARRIEALRADMAASPLKPDSFDLIWCEGAAYIMGGAKLCAPGGRFCVLAANWR